MSVHVLFRVSLIMIGPMLSSHVYDFFFFEFGVYCLQISLQDMIATSTGELRRYCAISKPRSVNIGMSGFQDVSKTGDI